jgi:hypothetical protein
VIIKHEDKFTFILFAMGQNLSLRKKKEEGEMRQKVCAEDQEL